MKHIIVCFKLIYDYDQVLISDWSHLASQEADISYVRQIYNCFDESALELALRMKDFYAAQGEEIQLTALTVADESCLSFLKTLYAIGYDNVVRVDPIDPDAFSPLTVARQIFSYIKSTGFSYDALLFGEKAAPFDSGQVPYYVAQLLQLPTLSGLTSLEATKDGYLAHCRTETTLYKVQVTKPAVYLVGNCKQTYLRVPTLREKLRGSKKEITCRSYSHLEEKNIKPGRILYEPKTRSSLMLEDASPKKLALQLLEIIKREGPTNENCRH